MQPSRQQSEGCFGQLASADRTTDLTRPWLILLAGPIHTRLADWVAEGEN